MNKITICGRLVRDPEMRTTTTGGRVANLSVAVNRRKKPDGSQETDFFDVMAFGKLAELCSQYLNKGRQVLLTGRMEASRYEKDGQKRTYWNLMLEEMDFIGSRGDTGLYSDPPASAFPSGAAVNCVPSDFTEEPDDGLPF